MLADQAVNTAIAAISSIMLIAAGALGWFSRADRKKVDQWTIDLSAMDKSVSSLEAALDRSDKYRELIEARLATSEAATNSLHQQATSLQTQLTLEQDARKAENLECLTNLRILAKQIQALGGTVQGVKGL